MTGQFAGGRGEFVDHPVFDDKSILSRNGFSDIMPNSARFEQAFSGDGGRSAETIWIMTFTRTAARQAAGAPPAAIGAEGQHDFDFAFGTWQTLTAPHPFSRLRCRIGFVGTASDRTAGTA
ncbi:MAG: hypothetical protein JWQ01_3231 [Massilia sp.]|nr:hypothetical protein [Massilia sp.]